MQTPYGRNGPKIQPVKSKVVNENMLIFTLYKAMGAQDGGTDIPHSFFNLGARWGSVETPHPDRFTRYKEIRRPLLGWLYKTQDRSVRVQETSPHYYDLILDRPALHKSLCRLRYYFGLC